MLVAVLSRQQEFLRCLFQVKDEFEIHSDFSTDLKQLSDSRIDDAVCFGIHGVYLLRIPPRRLITDSFKPELAANETTHDVIVWVDEVSFLLRRIEHRMISEGREVEMITTYKPVINAEIPEEKLDFDFPEN